MSSKKGIWSKPMAAAEEFYSDECILNGNPDGSLGFVNPLLRRAQVAEGEVERLSEALQACRMFIHGRHKATGGWACPDYVISHLNRVIKDTLALVKSDGDTLPKAAGEQS